MAARIVAVVFLFLATAWTAPARAQQTTVHGVARSFDGTPIAFSFFAPAGSDVRPVPVVFHTHGWAGKRTETVSGTVKFLLDEGYAVLTWDARGFGDSGGEANVDSRDFEVRDVQTLIDLAARQDAVLLDGPGDPRMGMVGGSYAGGIQLMTASADPRVDVIVPEIAWHDLPRSLRPNGVFKFGWGSVLYGGGAATGSLEGLDSEAGPQFGVYDPHIHRGYAEATGVNDWSDETERWFDERSPKHYLDSVRIPTLIIQGTSDTLFTLIEGIDNEAAIRRNGAPTKMIFFCGGHTLNPAGSSCRTDPVPGPKQSTVLRGATAAWLDRYLRGGSSPTGARIDYQLQDGTFRTANALPATRVTARGGGRIVNQVVPTSGAVLAATPSPDGVRFAIPLRAGATVLGVPRATVWVTGIAPDAAVLLKLIDRGPDGRLVVADDQVTPIRVRDLTGGTRRYTVDMNGYAWRVEDGHELLLEVSSTSNDHNSSRVPGAIDVEVSVQVPVVNAVEGARAQVLGSRVSRSRSVLPATGIGDTGVVSFALLAAAAMGAALLRRERRVPTRR